MSLLNKIYTKIMKYAPKEESLKNSLLYRIIGERLFRPELWKLDKRGVAGGLAVGVFIALTPTIGVQMLLCGLAAYFLRVNMPIAIACAWISNPATGVIIYPLQFKLGLLIYRPFQQDQIISYSQKIEMLVRFTKVLWTGSIVSAAFFSFLSYVFTVILWEHVEKFIEKYRTNVREEE